MEKNSTAATPRMLLERKLATTPKAMKEFFGGMLRNLSKQTAMPAAA